MKRSKKMNALKLLQELDYQHKREQYRSTPAHAIVRTTFSDRSANGLTKCVLAFLELKGYKAWRQTSEGRYRPGEVISDVLGHRRQLAGKWLPGQNRGAADVGSIINGRFVAIEVKIKDRQSEAQLRYQQEVERSGGVYIVVRSFEEFVTFYNGSSSPVRTPNLPPKDV